MGFDYNKKLNNFSKSLRKQMTREEKHLWYDFLKELPVTVYRQKILGDYIVDFYCASAKLVIEIDGSQHYEEDNELRDLQRDNYLNSLGLTVLRYSNRDVNERFKDVCNDICKYLNI
ncbi:MAG: endonuclease domain-containing protein [Clostridia bacterium]|nr:endonuclease domain-containing protein [Clostridia bacterium]